MQFNVWFPIAMEIINYLLRAIKRFLDSLNLPEN
jgi:hypothetical protein